MKIVVEIKLVAMDITCKLIRGTDHITNVLYHVDDLLT